MRLKVVETSKRRGVHLEDVSDDEEEAPNLNSEPEVEQDEENILRVFFRVNIVEVSCYDERLETKALLD